MGSTETGELFTQREYDEMPVTKRVELIEQQTGAKINFTVVREEVERLTEEKANRNE